MKKEFSIKKKYAAIFLTVLSFLILATLILLSIVYNLQNEPSNSLVNAEKNFENMVINYYSKYSNKDLEGLKELLEPSLYEETIAKAEEPPSIYCGQIDVLGIYEIWVDERRQNASMEVLYNIQMQNDTDINDTLHYKKGLNEAYDIVKFAKIEGKWIITSVEHVSCEGISSLEKSRLANIQPNNIVSMEITNTYGTSSKTESAEAILALYDIISNATLEPVNSMTIIPDEPSYKVVFKLNNDPSTYSYQFPNNYIGGTYGDINCIYSFKDKVDLEAKMSELFLSLSITAEEANSRLLEAQKALNRIGTDSSIESVKFRYITKGEVTREHEYLADDPDKSDFNKKKFQTLASWAVRHSLNSYAIAPGFDKENVQITIKFNNYTVILDTNYEFIRINGHAFKASEKWLLELADMG